MLRAGFTEDHAFFFEAPTSLRLPLSPMRLIRRLTDRGNFRAQPTDRSLALSCVRRPTLVLDA